MKVGELRELLKDVPDEADIDFLDPNFGGVGESLDRSAIQIHHGGFVVLVSPPLWVPCE